MAFWNWSKVAANNATADSSINWSEGLSPSSVNDSARAMMARLAEERDDFSGLLATGGTSTAYTVTTNQGLNTPTPTDGQMIAITVNATNGAAATLAADGGTAFPIQTSPGVGVAAGVLVSGSPYTLKFSAANSAWMLRDFYGSPFTVPLGGVVIFTAGISPNSNFAFAIGQAISRTTYAAYFSLVGTTFGNGDGLTTFNIPDLRERMLAFQGTMGGASSPSRITPGGSGIDGTLLGAAGGAQSYAIAQGNLPSYTLPNTLGISDSRTWATNNALYPSSGTPGGIGAGSTVGFAAVQAVSVTGGGIGITGGVQSGGSGNALATMPPTIMLTALVRIF
jgi:microcystin-dependent protein